jgi:hypothetical protein
MDGYRVAVDTYRNAQSKEQKREMERLINEIKTNFRSEISQNDPRVKRLTKVKRELFTMTEHPKLFELSSKEKSAWNKKVSELTNESTKIESKIEEIKNNKVFQNAFEWRFEFPEVLDDNGDYVGFDVVIGNPPYVQIQKMDFDFDIIKTKYQTFEQMGDIYTLFYEKGLEILSKNGVLSFITSNKWLRANYGQSLRQFFCSHTSCLQLIDFNYFQVFSEASVDTNILTYTHGTTEEIENATLVQQDFELEYINEYIKQNKIKISRLSSSYWSIIPQEKTDLKEKLKIHSKELKDWDISINYGIKTGLNDAFIINKEIRHKIISKDPKSEDLIFPYLRGRDTRRYGIQHEDLYLIATLPSLEINIEDYQGIKDYLEQFLPKLNQTGDTFINSEGKKEKTRKKTSGKWFETQDSIAYWQDFKKEKLVYAETMRIHKNDLSNFPRFGFDDESFFCDKTTFIATGDNIRYLLGILNSKIGRYLIKEYVTKLDTGGYMMQKVFVEVIPIKIPSTKEKANIEYIVKKVIDAKKKNLLADTTKLESQIDHLVYQLYGLTEEEIEIIENE